MWHLLYKGKPICEFPELEVEACELNKPELLLKHVRQLAQRGYDVTVERGPCPNTGRYVLDLIEKEPRK